MKCSQMLTWGRGVYLNCSHEHFERSCNNLILKFVGKPWTNKVMNLLDKDRCNKYYLGVLVNLIEIIDFYIKLQRYYHFDKAIIVIK